MQTARILADSTQPGARTDATSESENKLLALIAGGLIGTMAFAQPLGAEELVLHAKYYSSETYLELMSYVQEIGGEQPSIGSPHESPHNFSPHNFTPIDGETYSALRNFVQRIGANQSVHLSGDDSAPEQDKQLLLAAAEQPKAANPAKAKAAKPAKLINPEDATYVGSQV